MILESLTVVYKCGACGRRYEEKRSMGVMVPDHIKCPNGCDNENRNYIHKNRKY